MYGLNGAPAIWQRYVDGLFQATIANPLNNLTRKNVRFLWSKDCQVAFEQIKKEICSPKILVHYDPSLPLTLASDASPVGIGCVLSHVYTDGSERPIAFASRTYLGREKYSQIDKEALSIVWAGLYSRKFRKNVLEELHAGHLGIVKMKAIARSFVYWKNIDNDIEEAAKNCVDCARYKADPQNLKFITGNIPVCPGNVFM
ncbi:uncharacterized protein K02A2.6 [Trichonephila clavipes]|nr:uncharacterized protein K02A2.6 [Trichonephila clavipes]